MKFSAAVASALLCAGSAVAAPGTALRRERAARRMLERSGNFMIPADDVQQGTVVNGNQTSHVSYSTNWAGAVLIGTGYTEVTATFVVPTPKAPTGGSSSKTYSASAWVGIDGDTCTTSILQTGIDFNVEGGAVTFDAWYEWYPAYAYDFTSFAIEAGHTITMTVTATSKKTGSAVLKNVSTGKSVTHTFASQTESLCETNAEWIVEDFEEGSSLVPFADFGKITFTDATAKTSSGTVGPTGATIIDLRQSSKVLTSCSTGTDSVTCSYV